VVSRLQFRDVAADGLHHTRAVGAHDVREVERQARHPGEDEQVEVIEGGGLEGDDHVARARLGRPGDVHKLQLLRATVGPDRHGHHRPEI
jgi:hypothetical protein